MKKLFIISIGNPGKEYEGTRHSVGHAYLDYLARHQESPFWEFIKSDVFMNQSGEFIKKHVANNKKALERLIVAHDDLDIEFGKHKLSFAKDSAGHRGVQSAIKHLKTNKFWRLRLGTANKKLKSARAKDAVSDFVLAKFTPAEKKQLSKIFKEASHAIFHQFSHA